MHDIRTGKPTKHETVEQAGRHCSLRRHLTWTLLLLHCPLAMTSTGRYLPLSADIAAIIFPRTYASRYRPYPHNLRHQQPEQQPQNSQPHHEGVGTRSTIWSLAMVKPSSSSGNKLRSDRQNPAGRHHQGSTTAFVISLKNPLFSIWKRIRKTTMESRLSALQDHEEVVAAVIDTDDEVRRQEDVSNGRRECQTVELTRSTPKNGEGQVAETDGSVHLQLTQKSQPTEAENTVEDSVDTGKKRSTTIQELAYTSRIQRKTYKALNTCRRKFEAFLNYQGANSTVIPSSEIISRQVDISHKDHGEERREWRELWKDRRLLTDRTEFLAVYHSDRQDDTQQTKTGDKQHRNRPFASVSTMKRRGGFADLLYLYTDRLWGILQDENEDQNGATVKDWLEENYGKNNTNRLVASQFLNLSESEQLAELQKFADWFRSVMPYYYDKCSVCSASFKDDTAAAASTEQSPEDTKPNDQSDLYENGSIEGSNYEEGDEDDDDDQGTFLGYIYPDDHELCGKASRTELYQCHRCREYTRFPRYNSAHAIIGSKRGRCGEYSTLVYRFLRSLDLEARWVVDWADHVWAEVLVEGDNGKRRWVHFDPCEAAVDNPLLYQGWGKKQTYVIGLYSPSRRNMDEQNRVEETKLIAPLVEDVTKAYTTDSLAKIGKRREESEEEVHTAINEAISELRVKLGLDQTD